MDRAAASHAEIHILSTLVKQIGSRVERAEIARTLQYYGFTEPERRIVFESICALLPRDRFSAEQLAIHLNNRGFPDVDLEPYFTAAHPSSEFALELAMQLSRSGQNAEL